MRRRYLFKPLDGIKETLGVADAGLSCRMVYSYHSSRLQAVAAGDEHRKIPQLKKFSLREHAPYRSANAQVPVDKAFHGSSGMIGPFV